MIHIQRIPRAHPMESILDAQAKAFFWCGHPRWPGDSSRLCTQTVSYNAKNRISQELWRSYTLWCDRARLSVRGTQPQRITLPADNGPNSEVREIQSSTRTIYGWEVYGKSWHLQRIWTSVSETVWNVRCHVFTVDFITSLPRLLRRQHQCWVKSSREWKCRHQLDIERQR